MTDRNLLVGMLALQADLINRDQFALATASWTREKSTSMAEVLVNLGFLDANARARLEAMADQQLSEAEPEGQSTLAAFASIAQQGEPDGGEAATHAGDQTQGFVPTMAPKVEQLATILLSNQDVPGASLGPSLDAGSADAPTLGFVPPSESIVRVAAIGAGAGESRYSRTQLHAKGGIGQVWLARDGDLGREVALKELRPEQARNTAAYSRFVEEARITGQLEHPSIVPVYELATSPVDGKPFYTMRFIRGRTLHEAIKDFHKKRVAGEAGPLERAALLSAFVAVCNAVGYAHSRSVIHRDLKGQNVVLGDYGEVMLLDWGLAKLVSSDEKSESTSATDSRTPVTLIDDLSAHDATVQGQVLGTPSYMAPEQAEGRVDAIGTRTDIYGLGAILYEILAGTPPYTGSNTNELLRRVREDPPAPPRELDPATPRALEAICSRAMSRKPEDRYATALELADDVRRWLADEPVSAYREPWPKRLSRWSKRHRTAVAAAAVLLVTGTAALGVATVLVGRERDEASRQRHQARQAVDTMYTTVAEQWLEDRLDPVQHELLEKALAYYKEYAGADASDPVVRLETARAELRLADVYRKLGRHEEAGIAYGNAIDRFQALVATDPRGVEPVRQLAIARTRLGAELASRGTTADRKQAETLYKQASTELGRRIAIESTPDLLLDAARADRLLGELERGLGRPEEAIAAYESALSRLQKADAEQSALVEPRQELAAAADGLGLALIALGKGKEAEIQERKAVRLLEALVAEAPNLPRLRDALSRAYNSLALFVRDSGDPAEAQGLFKKQITVNERLAEDFPDRPDYKRTLARALENLGVQMLDARSPVREVEPLLRRAVTINEGLAEKYPSVQDYRRDLATNLNQLAELLSTTTRRLDAEAIYQRAIALDEALALETPESTRFRFTLGGKLSNLGKWYNDSGKLDKAIASYQKAATKLEEVAAAEQDNPAYRRELARTLNNLGVAYWTVKKHQEAEDAFRRAEASYERLVSLPKASPNDSVDQGFCLSNHGQNQSSGKLPGAEKSLRGALAAFQAVATNGTPAPNVRRGLGVARVNLGEWLNENGGQAEAEPLFREAIDQFEALTAEFANVPAYASDLSAALGDLGKLYLVRKQPEDARPLLERAVRIARPLHDANPRDPSIRGTLITNLDRLSDAYEATKAYVEAARVGEEMLRITSKDPGSRVGIAKLLVRCSKYAADDPKLVGAKRAVVIGGYTDRALSLLRETIELGELKPGTLEDPLFASLRDRDGFQSLQTALADTPGQNHD